jgi:hypothetical protein
VLGVESSESNPKDRHWVRQTEFVAAWKIIGSSLWAFPRSPLLLGLGVRLAMPLGPVAAAILGDTQDRANHESAAKVDGAIVVAGKNNNKNWNNKKVAVARPYRVWNKGPYRGTVIGGVALGTILGAAAYSAVAPPPNLWWVLGEPGVDARLLGLLRPSACSSTDRAPDFESGGCRFEPCQARH